MISLSSLKRKRKKRVECFNGVNDIIKLIKRKKVKIEIDTQKITNKEEYPVQYSKRSITRLNTWRAINVGILFRCGVLQLRNTKNYIKIILKNNTVNVIIVLCYFSNQRRKSEDPVALL